MIKKICLLTSLFLVQFVIAQSSKKVDFKSVDAFVEIDTLQKSVSGKISYIFEVNQATDTIFLDAKNMTFYDVKVNGKSVQNTNTSKQLQLVNSFTKGKYTLTFNYHAVPKQAIYFIGWKKNQTDKNTSQIWTQGQGKYTSNWFPSFDDVREKVIFNLDIRFNSAYEVISNGVLKNKETANGKTTWQYQMENPMSSYLLVLAIGKFEKKTENSASKIPLEYYYEAVDKNKLPYTYKYSKQIFDFFEKETGFAYPWSIYKQVPVRDFMYAGMENTSATLFSNEYVVDSLAFNDQNYINVNAHELAHQWFGNSVTAETSQHHWLQEGFATYYALLAEKQLFGEDYFYWELFKYAVELQEVASTDKIPLLNEKASTLTFYKKGAWALYTIHQQIGDQKFKKAIKNYLNNNQFKAVTTADFLKEISKVSDFDIQAFEKKWLNSSRFPEQDVFDLLLKYKFIKEYMELQKLRSEPLKDKYDGFKRILNSKSFYPLKEEVIYQLKEEAYPAKKELLLLALQQKDPKVDLALAFTTGEIQDAFRIPFEQLMDSKSYRAQEVATFKLWKQYPEHSVRYLEYTKGRVGFNNKNLELQWLYMSIVTRGYHAINLGEEVAKLVAYTSTDYDAEIREIAFQYCLEIQLVNYDILRNLIQATTHHRWQLVKYAKTVLLDLLKEKPVRESFAMMMEDLSEAEITQLQKLYEQLNATKAR